MAGRPYNPWAPGANYTGPALSWKEGLGTTAIGAIDERCLAFVGAADAAPLGGHAFPPGAQISDVQTIAPYSWTIPDKDNARVLIPGSPPIWKDSRLPLKLPSDEDVYDQRTKAAANEVAEVTPTHNVVADPPASLYMYLLALAASVSLCTPSFRWLSTDIVIGRDSLLFMMRWVINSQKLSDFRVDLNLVGASTVVFTRWIPKRTQKATPGSYGVSYERNETVQAAGCESARWGGHYRVLSYNFGGLHMVVNSKASARLSDSADELADTLAKTHLEQEPRQDLVSTLGGLTYRQVGTLTPQSEVIELATKSKAWVQNYKRREVYPVLAFGGIPHHILALHQKGTFVEVRREQVGITQSLINADMTTQGDFVRMRALLDNLRQLVITRGAAKPLSLLCLDRKLQVFERLDGATLPADFIAQFTEGNHEL